MIKGKRSRAISVNPQSEHCTVHAKCGLNDFANNSLKIENIGLKEKLMNLSAQIEKQNTEIRKLLEHQHQAHIVQQSILPRIPDITLIEDTVDVYADIDMAFETGGDFYDLFKTDNFKFYFSIGDVSGKGIPAALFSMVVMTSLKHKAMDGTLLQDLSEIANRQLYCSQTTMGHMFATVWMGRLNTKTGEIEYVNAGHEPPIFVKKDKSISSLTEVSGLPIAAYYNPNRPEKNRYILHHTTLEVGDTLLLYTDGATEIRSKSGENLGREGLIRLVRQYYDGTNESDITIKGLITYLQRSLIQHGNHAERDDDIAFLGLRRL